MATTAIWDVKGWLGKIVIYVENPDKTQNPEYDHSGKQERTDKEIQGLADVIDYAMRDNKAKQTAGIEGDTTMKQYYVSGLNCTPATARDEMMAVKKRYGKDDGIMAFHGYQSFAENEVTPDTAHEIGIKLAQELWGGRFQVIVATHLDKASHIHNHFVLNSVSHVDGYRYNDCTATYMEMRKASDRLCLEYGLSVIKDPKREKSKHYGEWQAEQQNRPTWRGLIKSDVDEVIAQSMTDKQFFYLLHRKGYEIKFGKDITVRPPGKERGVKLARNFGDDYTHEAICNRILTQHRQKIPMSKQEPIRKVYRVYGNFRKAKKIGGLRGLYLHYCYKLGILPKQKQSPAKLHFLFREDLRKMDTISKETRLLCANHIDTREQLFSYQQTLVTKMDQLTDDRKHLRYQIRSIKDEEKRSGIKSEISSLSNRISELRREVKLCDGITVRSVEMKEKLQQVRQDENKEKEEHSHEHGRRGSRPNR